SFVLRISRGTMCASSAVVLFFPLRPADAAARGVVAPVIAGMPGLERADSSARAGTVAANRREHIAALVRFGELRGDLGEHARQLALLVESHFPRKFADLFRGPSPSPSPLNL